MIPALRLDGILNWQVLLDHLGGRPLLPNLGTILQNSDSTVCLKWLRILLAPSVHSLTTSHDHERPLEMVFEILGIARQRCPNLRSLTISARGFEADDVKEDPDPASLQHRLLQLVSSFVAFQRLTYLRSNGSILYPQAFLVLSELPCLERVAVEVGKMPQLVYDITLPGTAFSCLRELGLENVSSCSWIMDFWSLPVLKQLTKASIAMGLDVLLSDGDDEYDEDWGDKFLSQVCIQSSNLTHLTFEAMSLNWGRPPLPLSRNTQDLFRLVPFQSLVLRGVRFEDGYKFLSTAWPEIVELSCSNQPVSLVELIHFAQNLPNLRKLELNVDMSGSLVPDYNSSSICSPRHLAFYRLCTGAHRGFERTKSQSERLAGYVSPSVIWHITLSDL
ncbi:fanconi anemia group M protein [Ceratobasidium sp. AG-Ba]|nr:fanconi anemia group M protein [Ceratobasidium sp. AG-Ba]